MLIIRGVTCSKKLGGGGDNGVGGEGSDPVFEI